MRTIESLEKVGETPLLLRSSLKKEGSPPRKRKVSFCDASISRSGSGCRIDAIEKIYCGMDSEELVIDGFDDAVAQEAETFFPVARKILDVSFSSKPVGDYALKKSATIDFARCKLEEKLFDAVKEMVDDRVQFDEKNHEPKIVKLASPIAKQVKELFQEKKDRTNNFAQKTRDVLNRYDAAEKRYSSEQAEKMIREVIPDLGTKARHKMLMVLRDQEYVNQKFSLARISKLRSMLTFDRTKYCHLAISFAKNIFKASVGNSSYSKWEKNSLSSLLVAHYCGTSLSVLQRNGFSPVYLYKVKELMPEAKKYFDASFSSEPLGTVFSAKRALRVLPEVLQAKESLEKKVSEAIVRFPGEGRYKSGKKVKKIAAELSAQVKQLGWSPVSNFDGEKHSLAAYEVAQLVKKRKLQIADRLRKRRNAKMKKITKQQQKLKMIKENENCGLEVVAFCQKQLNKEKTALKKIEEKLKKIESISNLLSFEQECAVGQPTGKASILSRKLGGYHPVKKFKTREEVMRYLRAPSPAEKNKKLAEVRRDLAKKTKEIEQLEQEIKEREKFVQENCKIIIGLENLGKRIRQKKEVEKNAEILQRLKKLAKELPDRTEKAEENAFKANGILLPKKEKLEKLKKKVKERGGNVDTQEEWIDLNAPESGSTEKTPFLDGQNSGSFEIRSDISGLSRTGSTAGRTFMKIVQKVKSDCQKARAGLKKIGKALGCKDGDSLPADT